MNRAIEWLKEPACVQMKIALGLSLAFLALCIIY